MATISNSDKKDTTETAVAASRSNITLRCGDCLHHKGTSHPAIGQRCNDRGVKTYAAAPNCYTANVEVFKKVAPETFNTLAGIISHFTPQQSRVFMGLLKSAGSLEKHNYTFLQKVYFRIGEDYLDTYYAGYVLGSGINQNLMIVGSTLFTGVKHPVVAHLDSGSVYSVETFAKKKKALLAHGRLYVPRKPHRNEVTVVNYTPPNIETSRELLEALASKNVKKRPKTKDSLMEVDLSHYRTDSKKGNRTDRYEE